MLCFQQLTQLNLVIAVENTPTRASAFNLSDPAVVVNERAVTSRHRNEEYSSNPHPVSGSSVNIACPGININTYDQKDQILTRGVASWSDCRALCRQRPDCQVV